MTPVASKSHFAQNKIFFTPVTGNQFLVLGSFGGTQFFSDTARGHTGHKLVFNKFSWPFPCPKKLFSKYFDAAINTFAKKHSCLKWDLGLEKSPKSTPKSAMATFHKISLPSSQRIESGQRGSCPIQRHHSTQKQKIVWRCPQHSNTAPTKRKRGAAPCVARRGSYLQPSPSGWSRRVIEHPRNLPRVPLDPKIFNL